MIWLIGLGNMGLEYAKVLKALNVEYIAIGRSEKTAYFFETTTRHAAHSGGLNVFLKNNPPLPEAAIVAVNIENLVSVSSLLLNYGVKRILLEKPGFGDIEEIDEFVKVTNRLQAKIVLAYNRRFYSSVLKAEEIIKEDGGVKSFNFEFTEWTHTIDSANYSDIALKHWLLGNSSHVIDTAFFLGGQPAEICCFCEGKNQIDWHPSGSIYVGAGRAQNGALFNYSAGWQLPGRWRVEILTQKHRLYLCPMETLQIQDMGTVMVNPVDIDDRLDKAFKPGFFLQLKAFLEEDYSRFCSIEEQKEHLEEYYLKISKYDK